MPRDLSANAKHVTLAHLYQDLAQRRRWLSQAPIYGTKSDRHGTVQDRKDAIAGLEAAIALLEVEWEWPPIDRQEAGR